MLKPTNETVILVDANDRAVGTSEKHAAHQGEPQRHRAFSVFAFNENGETLIQRRSLGKYHSAGLWANTCCGHPRPDEDIVEAAQRRTFEELGFRPNLTPLTQVCYTLNLGQGLWELEYTHVFRSEDTGPLDPNPDEVCETKWIAPEDLLADVHTNPENYARWFRLYVLKHFNSIFVPPAQVSSLHG